ncbi:MAG: phosphomannose isomerase type II C-terminal cupin domain [Oscillospiraceae bacterium]|jgi:mannose-6-phosphate isomerase-like protein (cupin superfamily)|nr:phosphomannose isomerase type II C-terminal cupin domain [Oscillospiraceae bacterium]
MYTEERPWGSFTILEDSDTHKVKRLVVNPGHRLSAQKHSKRSEHWVVVVGDAEVELDDVPKIYNYGEHIYIPVETKHRLKNIGDKPLEIIEVQYGTYFGEDDIVRYEDDYKRNI